ncbi:hypothetical protein Ptr902_02046 [Pyrenophora tritici-repentis]|nr:hypothetical protein Ptr902_02046 [Pyrenophora tritici-repentis]
MSVNELFRHLPNPIPGNDNELQGTHVDDGHAGSQYSEPSLPSGGNGSWQYSTSTNNAGGYQNHQYTGIPIFPQPDPVENQYPQQIDPGDFLPDTIQHHGPQSEASPINPSLPEGGMKQNEVGHDPMLTHWSQPQSQPQSQPYNMNTVVPGRESNDYRMSNLQHQVIAPYASPEIAAHKSTLRQPGGTLYNTQPCYGYLYFEQEPWNNHHIDLGQQPSNHTVLVSKDHHSEPEAPWSSVNTHQDHRQMLASTVSSLVYKIGSNEAGCANGDNGGSSSLNNSIPNRHWMQPNTDTFRGDNNQANNRTNHQDLLSAQLSRRDQSFRQCSTMFQYMSYAPIGNVSQHIHVQNRLVDTADATSTPKNVFLPVPTRRPSRSSRRSSIASVASSDSFQCPSCPAMFSGVYGKGNWGRHNRQKHNGESKFFSCEKGCNKTFQRKDALLKHYRGRCHQL